MKKLRKVLALVLAMVMVLGMSTSVFAATITIENPQKDETYTAYKIFDASINADDSTKVSYTIKNTDAWWSVVIGSAIADATTGVYTANGLKFTPTGNTNEYTVEEQSDFSAANFAALLNKNKSGKTGTVIYEDGEAKNNTSLAPGYYFIDTTLGSLCSLVTENTAQNVYEKNTNPSVSEKKVKAAKDSTYTGRITADVGDILNYRITFNTGTKPTATENGVITGTATGIDRDYAVIDILGTGLTLDENSVAVATASDDAKWTKGTDYTVDVKTLTEADVAEGAAYAGKTVGQTVLIVTLKTSFDSDTQSYADTHLKLDDLAANANVYITYNAKLNENAITNNDNAKNSAKVNNDPPQETDTKTFSFTIKKTDNSTNPVNLKGVKFTLVNANTDDDDNGKYYIAPFDANNVNEDVWMTNKNILTTNAQGEISITGIAAGTYTLTETETLAGYNKLDGPIIVTIGDDGSVSISGNGVTNATQANGVITIVNAQGSVLPSTGGMGTTLFYVFGAVLVIGAGIVLVARRRMAK